MKRNLLSSLNTKQIGDKLTHNSPTILTAMGVAGLISTTSMAIKATPKAMKIIANEETYLEEGEVLANREILRLTWKCYTPAVIMGVVTTACIVSANSINLKRNAALASVYSLTDKTLKEYQKKVIETIGEKKETKIKEEIDREVIMNDQVLTEKVINTGKGETLCYDRLSGRYFYSDVEYIRKIQNDLNLSLLTSMWVSLNETYYALGLAGIDLGDRIGWGVDDPINFRFSSMLSDGKPCLVLSHDSLPTPESSY